MAGITSTKKIKGQPHLLAYITPNEVEKLKALGGQETMTEEGIPAYPEYDNYGYSSSKDFKEGNRSKSNDPNVRRDSTFETFRGGKSIGVDNQLKAKLARDQKAREEAQKALDRGRYYSPAANAGFFNRASIANSNFQKRQNIKLAQKRAFQKYQDIEQYVDMMDDYGLSAEQIAAKVAANPEYGYDLRNLKENSYGKENLISNKGTRIETTRPNLYDVNSNIPGRAGIIGNFLANKFRPDTYVTVKNTLNKARDYNTLAMDPYISREKLEALGNRGKTPDQINPPGGGGGGGGGGQQYIPFLPPEEIEEEEKTFDYRFGTGQNVGADVLRGYVANGGRITRAGGGIMNVVPRQGYFLGKIVKGVGKAIGSVADAAGKVLKSDVGKMAIAGLGAYYMGGGMNLGGARMFGNTGFGTSGFMSNLGRVGTFIKENPFKTIGLASVALPFLAGEAKPNEDIGMADRGGRLIDPLTGQEGTPASMRANIENAKIEAAGDPVKLASLNQKYNNMLFSISPYENYGTYAQGGRIKAQEGGLMNLGGMEKDYRAEGGFVPIGKQEKADDVPARLSVNEFVFTADAVRNAGGGDIDKGAEVMENMMKNLENGGTVSEESQGNTGAQEMFSVSERIGEVI